MVVHAVIPVLGRWRGTSVAHSQRLTYKKVLEQQETLSEKNKKDGT